MTVYHVVPAAGKWQVKNQSNKSVVDNPRLKRRAVERAKQEAGRGDSVVVHRSDGTVQGSY